LFCAIDSEPSQTGREWGKMKLYQWTIGVAGAAAVFLAAAHAIADPAAPQKSSFFRPYPIIDSKKWYVSSGWSNGDHQGCEWREENISAVNGNLQLKLSDQGATKRPYSCAEIHTNDRTGHGRYEARMKTAAGSGLNTAFFTYVGPPTGAHEHDEIDFEFIGKVPDTVDINVWTNGKSAKPQRIPLGFDASKDFHDYVIEWRSDSIRWYADGKLIYETPKGAPIPRNSGRLYFSLWSGTKIEDEWMGPFTYTGPVTAEVAWFKYTPLR
jgi:endo-1,3-1,4-beta-glycanase ExoK